MKIEIMQIVNTLLQDVAEDPKRLNRAMELAEDQIVPILTRRETYSVMLICPGTCDGFECTRPEGHSGDHIAQGRTGIIHRRWPNEP